MPAGWRPCAGARAAYLQEICFSPVRIRECSARPETPRWLRGRHNTLAVRVTDHPLAAALCRQLGHPLVSTSANRSGQSPALSLLAVQRQLGPALDLIIPGPLGRQSRPTVIRDLASGKTLRPA